MDKILILDDGNYASRLEGILNEIEECEVKKVKSLEEIYSSVAQLKPQMILLDVKSAKNRIAKKTIKIYPFVPVAVYGDFGKNQKEINKTIKKFISYGFVDCFDAQLILSKELIVSKLRQILWKGLAKEEIWQKEKVISESDLKTNFYRNVFASGFTFCIILLAGFIFKDNILVDSITSPKVYNIQYRNLSGLVLNRNILWTCDWQTQAIYKHLTRANLKIERIFTFPEMRFSGITFGEGYIWTLDPWQKKIYKHIIDDKLSVLEEYSTPGPNPTAIACNGNYLFTCDNALNKIFVHKIDNNLTVLKEYSLPLMNPTGLFVDKKHIWLIDSQTNRLYRYILGDFELVVDSIFVLPTIDEFKVSSITGDKKYLWLASEKTGKIYRYPKEFLEPIKGGD